MVKRIAVVSLTPDDFLSAPRWVKETLEAYSQGRDWELQVYHELKDDDTVDQMADLLVGESSYLYGPLPMVMRHVARSNLAAIARGSMMVRIEGAWTPIHDEDRNIEKLASLVSTLPHEAAWLLDVSIDTVMALAAVKEPSLERFQEICHIMEPESAQRWMDNHINATTAVALL